MTTEATTGSLSCLEGEGELRGFQLQHAASPLDVTKFYTLNLWEQQMKSVYPLLQINSLINHSDFIILQTDNMRVTHYHKEKNKVIISVLI